MADRIEQAREIIKQLINHAVKDGATDFYIDIAVKEVIALYSVTSPPDELMLSDEEICQLMTGAFYGCLAIAQKPYFAQHIAKAQLQKASNHYEPLLTSLREDNDRLKSNIGELKSDLRIAQKRTTTLRKHIWDRKSGQQPKE